MDDFIDLLAKLNWFETFAALFKIGTPSHRFAVDRNCGWSGQQIEEMLKAKGIKIWHRGFTKTTLKFRVANRQARYAEYLLWRNGIVVKSKPVDPRNAKRGTPSAPAQPQRKAPPKRGLLEEIFDSIIG